MNYYQHKIQQFRNAHNARRNQLNTVKSMRHYINNNYDKNIHLNRLARKHFTSKYHLLRLFKRYYGITPRQYLIDKRIEQSKCLLKSGESVSQACYAVGFESPSSFCNLFKRKIGKSPSEYQKEQLSIYT